MQARVDEAAGARWGERTNASRAERGEGLARQSSDKGRSEFNVNSLAMQAAAATSTQLCSETASEREQREQWDESTLDWRGRARRRRTPLAAHGALL